MFEYFTGKVLNTWIFTRNHGHNIVDKFTKVSKTGVFWNVLLEIFRNFLVQLLKNRFGVVGEL